MRQAMASVWPTETWETAEPGAAGFDQARAADAVAYAEAYEPAWPRRLDYPDGRYVGIVARNETGPWSTIAATVRARGGPRRG